MLLSLKQTIWALAISLSVAESPAAKVTWDDLTAAISKYPRYFGEVAAVSQKGLPVFNGVSFDKGHSLKVGHVEPMKCFHEKSEIICMTACRECMGNKGCERCRGKPAVHNNAWISTISWLLQKNPPALHNLKFTFEEAVQREKLNTSEPAGDYETFHFTQNLDKLIPIDNSYLQFSSYQDETGGWHWNSPDPLSYRLYTGKFDNKRWSKTCDKSIAGKTAAKSALQQPGWEAKYSPEYYLTYTVQDGSLYKAWRVTFNTAKDFGEDFLVWVDASNCNKVIAAASAKMDPYISTLGAFVGQQTRLSRERESKLKETTYPLPLREAR